MVTECSPLIPAPKIKAVTLRSLLTPRVVVVLVNYALLALIDMSFFVLLPVFLSTPISSGGLGMTPSLVGACLAGHGIANGAASMFLFVPFHRKFGTRAVLRTGIAAFTVVYALFPVINWLARLHGGLNLSVWIFITIQLALATIPEMAFSESFAFVIVYSSMFYTHWCVTPRCCVHFSYICGSYSLGSWRHDGSCTEYDVNHACRRPRWRNVSLRPINRS